MKKIFLLFLIFINFSFASINEYVSDVYFANGIDTSRQKAQDAKDKLAEEFELSNLSVNKSINNWQVSYNHTHGIGIDFYESFLQKIDEHWYTSYALEFSGLLKISVAGLAKMLAKKVAKEEIEKQAKKYSKMLAKEIFTTFVDASGLVKGLTKSDIEALFQLAFEKKLRVRR